MFLMMIFLMFIHVPRVGPAPVRHLPPVSPIRRGF